MPTTSYGTPYVASSDLVSAYPGVSTTLATRIDDVSLKGNGINAQVISYTLVLTDGGKNVTMNVAGANTLTVPTNASVAFPTGVLIGVANLGAGTCTITPAGGVTVNGTSLILAQYETGILMKTGTDSWLFAKGGGLPKASYSATSGSPTITTVSGKTCIQFTGSGSITLPVQGTCDILLVGGGGGGGQQGASGYAGGGGGGGGYVYLQNVFLPSGSLTVTVGGGGAANANGGDSIIWNYIAVGGGKGGINGYNTSSMGGSVGGVDSITTATASERAITNQGNVGGQGSKLYDPTNNTQSAGGGGGAGAAGGNGNNTTAGGAGGNGLANSITGTSVTRAGGGGGGRGVAGGGAGGTGGGGTGGSNGGAGTNATPANSGSGGGGGSRTGAGGSGASGIVILLLG